MHVKEVKVVVYMSCTGIYAAEIIQVASTGRSGLDPRVMALKRS